MSDTDKEPCLCGRGECPECGETRHALACDCNECSLAKLVRQMEQSLTDKVKEIEFLKRTVTDLEYSLADAQADLAHEKSIVED